MENVFVKHVLIILLQMKKLIYVLLNVLQNVKIKCVINLILVLNVNQDGVLKITFVKSVLYRIVVTVVDLLLNVMNV